MQHASECDQPPVVNCTLQSSHISRNDIIACPLMHDVGQICKVKCETCILPVGVGAFRPIFYGNGVVHATMLIHFDRQLIALQLCCWKILDDETLFADF